MLYNAKSFSSSLAGSFILLGDLLQLMQLDFLSCSDGDVKLCLSDSHALFVSLQVTYTFDAGPNAVIFTLQQHVAEFVQLVQHFFPPEPNGGQ